MRVTLLFGRICSGKSSFKQNSYRIQVSNIVKDLVKSQDRAVLSDTLHLNEKIGEEIVDILNAIKISIDKDIMIDKEVVVDGIRQYQIVYKVLEQYPDAELIWLEVPEDERKRRYENRKDIKDTEDFSIADNKSIELECQKIFGIFSKRMQTINNY